MRSTRIPYILLPISLIVPLVVIFFGWPAFVNWLVGPSPQPTPEAAGAPATATAQVVAAEVPTSRPPTAGLPATIEPAAVSTRPAPTATPEAAAQPTPTSAASTPTPVAASAPDPSAAVQEFYDRVSHHDFSNAAALWSPRMLASFPPQQNIDARFSQTQFVAVRRADVVSQNGQQAAVAVDLLESAADGQHHWSGTWQVVRGASGWLLDQPQLQAA